MAVLPRANDALNINPNTGNDEFLSVEGSDWLWAVTAVYVISFVRLNRSSPLTNPPTR